MSAMLAPAFGEFTVNAKALLEELKCSFPVDMDVELSFSDKMVATRGKAWVETVGEDMTGYIRLSSYLCGDDTWEDTLKHEYAHLLAGVDAQHGELWVDACRQVGCSIETDGNEMPHKEMRLRYKYTCECKVHYRARRIKFSQDAIVICMSCKTPLKDANINTCYMNLGMDELPYIPTYIQGVL